MLKRATSQLQDQCSNVLLPSYMYTKTMLNNLMKLSIHGDVEVREGADYKKGVKLP